jgi:hypothetical protein
MSFTSSKSIEARITSNSSESSN